MKQLNPKQTSFNKEDIVKEIEARTELGLQFLEVELDDYNNLLNPNKESK